MTLEKANGRSNITLSIDSNVLNEIKKNAKVQNLSVNGIVNNVLSKHILFYRHMIEQKNVVIPSKIFSSIIKSMDKDKQTELIKRYSFEIVPSIFAHHNISLTSDNLIKFCFERIGLWSGLYNTFSYHDDDNGNLCLVFEHVYGIKWSRIIEKSISKFIEDTLDCSTEQKIRGNVVMIKIFNKN